MKDYPSSFLIYIYTVRDNENGLGRNKGRVWAEFEQLKKIAAKAGYPFHGIKRKLLKASGGTRAPGI